MDPIFQRFGDVTIQRLEKPKPAPTEPETPETNEETINLKRSYPNSQISLKRFKPAPDTSPSAKSNPDDAETANSSESEISDYDSESEIESDGEVFNPKPSAAIADPEPVKPPEDSEDYDFDIKEKLKEMGEISFQTVKKGEVRPKKAEVAAEELSVTPARKVAEDDANVPKNSANLRRNIREVMDETKLDESTLAAQRQEAERLHRVQEQQRLLREYQRQAQQERMQHKVISLLQGSRQPGPAAAAAAATTTTRIGSTVLVKLPNGQTKSMTKLPKRPFDLTKVGGRGRGSMGPVISPAMGAQASGSGMLRDVRGLIGMKRPTAGNLTPSVSIAPVTKRLPMVKDETESESEDEEEEPKPSGIKSPVKEPETIDISSDEDCIVVSEPEDHDDTEEDPSNSGMHTNDDFNQPDAQGRVVVNIGHPDNEPDIFLAPQIARIIKPHQIGGVRFLFDNVIESTGRFASSAGFGCILAHSMGLGKTLQVVCFSDIFLRYTPSKTILCIMPINTLQNWMAEYNMWMPSDENVVNSPQLVHGEVRARNFNLYVLNDSHKTITARHKVIKAWKTDGGVLLIGYEQYRLLSLKKNPKSRRKGASVPEPLGDDKNKALFDDVHEALVCPGPDLVICDEGHRIKNSHASISLALKQMKTKRRVVLTGYPLQNNLMEYWCMVDFVRPNYLGSKTEFCNMFERPIMNGQCIDSTEADIKLMRYRAHVLHSLLVGFVQRRSHAVLQTALPQKEEYVLLVRMLPFQRTLYETFMNEVVRTQTVPNPLKAFAVCCKIWNHPDVLYNFLKKRAKGDAVDIDLEEVGSAAAPPSTSAADSGKSKKKQPTRPRKNAKGKKPAASVTPYNSALESGPGFEAAGLVPKQEFDAFSSSFGAFSNGGNQSFNGFNNPNSGSGFQSGGYWGPEGGFGGQDFFNNSQFNPNFSSSNANQAWVKKEEPCSSMMNATIKMENSNSSKGKINIISDIKLPMAGLGGSGVGFGGALGGDGGKIKILSDIKLEPKIEDDGDIKPEIRKMIKEEVKGEFDDEGKVDAPVVNKFGKDKEDAGIPYDWAIELLNDYLPGCIENSAKMEILFCIIRESIALGDRMLVFSQSLITLDLIEQFLQMNLVPGDTQRWSRNTSYYRLDGSTSALEREKLINEFNSNPKIHLFLVSTRAGSLGINLIGANRVIVLDASWNPCHDTQAVCRVYRYGQRKPCFVYRLVVDNCLEKKIYDRQINKQGMSDRVVDECNPDAHLTLKDVSTLCWDDHREEGAEKDWLDMKDNYIDVVLQKVIELHGRRLNKEPFQHESLLVDRKEKQLSNSEKRLAKKGYEREKQAARQPSYGLLSGRGGIHRPVASVRPMQQGNEQRPSRWIPAEHWQRQGMTAQEMTLPLDVVIPTNQPEKGNIVLKAGQKVLVLKSPKGVYMQLESGKIVAIKTAIKVKGKAEDNHDPTKMIKPPGIPPIMKVNPLMGGAPLLPPKKIVKPFQPGIAKMNVRSIRQSVPPNLVSRIQNSSYNKRDDGPGRPRGRPPLADFKRIDLNAEKHVAALLDATGASSSEDDEENEAEKLMLANMKMNKSNLFNRGLEGSSSGSSSNSGDEMRKQIAMISKPNVGKMRNVGAQPGGSALKRLEQTASAVLNENMPFQETLDSITNSYKDDSFEAPHRSDVAKPVPSDGSDHSDEVTYVGEQPPTQPYLQQQQPPPPPQHMTDVKLEMGQQNTADYYNNYNYNNYNNIQPYHAQAPPGAQNYAYPTQAPPGYDLVGYPMQAQQPPPPPQYNYGYQNAYAPPMPHYPPQQPGYDYNQALYGGYGAYPAQQYPTQAPPPPPAGPAPPQGMYPPNAAAAGYQEYPQYQQNQAPYFPNT